jgi:hypothetical protein
MAHFDIIDNQYPFSLVRCNARLVLSPGKYCMRPYFSFSSSLRIKLNRYA